jgi:hypothetical protein
MSLPGGFWAGGSRNFAVVVVTNAVIVIIGDVVIVAIVK